MHYHQSVHRGRVAVTEVILHCAAIQTGQFDGMSPWQVFSCVNRWHTERGFKHGFGYHGLFMPNGAYFPGRPWDMIGAQTIGHNVGTIGLLLIESQKIDRVGEFSDWFTVAQERSLKAKIGSVPGINKVSGHNDYAPKLCPGFKVKSADWLPAKSPLDRLLSGAVAS